MTESPEYASSINHDVDADGNVTVKLYDANKGKTPRTGGPYLDEVQAEEAERRRAKAEGREPDLDNVPPYVGTQLVTAAQLTDRSTDKSHYADSLPIVNEPVASYVAEFPKNEVDPTQADWDNNMDKVNALKGAQEYQELVDKNNTPDPEPKDEPDLDFNPDKDV
jgi:hypothetical protein